jgi:ubiquinone biosynthesis protein UbiJ
MRFRDEVIASYLNDEWRTPHAVHRLMDSRGECSDVAYALERLARAGKIENKHEAVMPAKGPPICVNYYRKLQKRR